MASGRRDEIEVQRAYYAQTAHRYHEMHFHEKDEHVFALSWLVGMLDFLEVSSLLDVGSGTGRAIAHIKSSRPGVRVLGVEPVRELREEGPSNGLSASELIDGDATQLDFEDGHFDVVCAFALLHHVRRPDEVVAEMLRVARKAVFISDSNNFGDGSAPVRAIKQALKAVGLWGVADFVKTRGRGYTISEGDGLAYSYSVFDNYEQIRRACRFIHVVNTKGEGRAPYRGASHVAVLGIKG